MGVTRLSRTNWQVITDVDPNQVYFNTAGDVIVPGDIAQLEAPTGFRGNYHRRFGANIYCPTCP